MRRMDRRYIPGNRWVECDLCGFGYRFRQMRKGVAGTQKGFDICPECFDEPNPGDKWKMPVKKEGVLEKVR